MSSIKKLAIDLIRHDALYRAGKAVITDKEFDDIKNKVKTKYPNHPVFKELKKGVILDGLDTPIFSEWYELFKDKPSVVVQPKIDGCAILLRYSNGFLSNAWTRKGKDKLYALTTVKNIPLEIKDKQDNLLIRGELYGVHKTPSYSQRLASGHLRKKDPTGKGLAFCAFEVLDSKDDPSKQQETFLSLGLQSSGLINVKTNVVNKVKTLFDNWRNSQLFSRFPTDGIVVRLADRQRQIESRANYDRYDWKIALKS